METVYIYPGVHPLYSVGAFVCALIMFIMISRILYNKRFGNSGEYLFLFLWILFFCVQDGIRGLFAAHVFVNDSALFILSSVFHLCSAVTVYVWVWFHLISLKDKVRHPLLIKCVTGSICLVQVVMVVINFFSKNMFYVDETGEYVSNTYRKVLFYLQFTCYLAIGIVSMVKYIRIRNTQEKQDLVATFCMNISPVCFGIFQMMYPDAPANSIGFSLACLIFYAFIGADYEKQLAEYRTKALYQEIIEKQNAELIQQKALLQKSLEAEEEASKAKTSFLFSMSHDIRTPMNAIIGFTSMAKKHVEDAKRTGDYLDKIETAGHQLLSLINQVLEMSRIESGKIILQKQKISVWDFVEIIRTVYGDIAKEKGIRLTINTDKVVHADVMADGDRIKQIITNIIGNAIKYTPIGGRINFSVTESEGEAEGEARYCFIVEDSGIGMSEEFVEHIFDEFSREESVTVNKIQGSGLGMSIVKRLTELLDGEIFVESQKGVGTRISVTIPMIVDTERKIIESQDIENASLKGMKILLVEDNEMNREIATEILEDEEALVDTATDGAEAVEKVYKMYNESPGDSDALGTSNTGVLRYDCVLMDIQMPVMNGYEATAKIREQEPEGKHIPIIAFSANAFEEDKKKSIEMGMDDHISKPIIVGDLLTVLMKYR